MNRPKVCLDRDLSEDGLDRDLSEDDLDRDLSEDDIDRGLSEDDLDRDLSEDDLHRDMSEANLDRDLSEDDIDRDPSEDDLDRDLSEDDLDHDLSDVWKVLEACIGVLESTTPLFRSVRCMLRYAWALTLFRTALSPPILTWGFKLSLIPSNLSMKTESAVLRGAG